MIFEQLVQTYWLMHKPKQLWNKYDYLAKINAEKKEILLDYL